MTEVDFVSLDVISEYCENRFFQSSGSDVLLVFLPSVNGKETYPYFPRISWAKELVKKYNILYIADPYQPLPQYKEPMGSWFIDPTGKPTLESLAKMITKVKKDICAKEVVFYGSSMGGYAAIILASLVDDSKAVAECPQVYLNLHPGSRHVCKNILDKSISIESIEPLAHLKLGRLKHLRIICSIFDRHYSQHVTPFIKDIENIFEDISCNIMLHSYMSAEYKKGHVAMNKKDAFAVIDEVTHW